MIPHGVEVFVGLEPIDLRWGFDRLAGLVTERLGRDARSRALFVFFGKRRDALKVLFFDGTGLCLFYKRLLCRDVSLAVGRGGHHELDDRGSRTR
jgi:transposase